MAYASKADRGGAKQHPDQPRLFSLATPWQPYTGCSRCVPAVDVLPVLQGPIDRQFVSGSTAWFKDRSAQKLPFHIWTANSSS